MKMCRAKDSRVRTSCSGSSGIPGNNSEMRPDQGGTSRAIPPLVLTCTGRGGASGLRSFLLSLSISVLNFDCFCTFSVTYVLSFPSKSC